MIGGMTRLGQHHRHMRGIHHVAHDVHLHLVSLRFPGAVQTEASALPFNAGEARRALIGFV